MHARLRVRQASDIPCALLIREGLSIRQNSDAFAPRDHGSLPSAVYQYKCEARHGRQTLQVVLATRKRMIKP